MIRQNPCLTDEDLAKRFSVSAATIRLDRQMLGIPQMRKRIEKQFLNIRPDFMKNSRFWIWRKGKGTRPVSYDRENDGQKRYGFRRSPLCRCGRFAQSLAGQVFTPVQVGNIKYKEPVGSGEQLVLKGKIALMKVNRKYIYISFFKRAAEVFRAKFIMEVSKQAGRRFMDKIAVDAMGGFAPLEIVKGAVLAVRDFHVPVVLVGDKEQIVKY